MFRAALVVCSALLLAACTVTVGTTRSLSQETVEQGISDTVLSMVGHPPEAVDCPDPLTAQPGNSARCVLTVGGKRYGVTATVTQSRTAAPTTTSRSTTSPSKTPGSADQALSAKCVDNVAAVA
ncbi:DUF4333 domain-containing protein [Amycolatopsis methanolica]|uniref:DUF4333 domain-containing protein n=1 Tax=Amycolatopsis methanolica TaxID=1814 RepID=UPI000375F7FF|nr:DUF4333 domain-containing protein [Amycolatopsis methanolica]